MKRFWQQYRFVLLYGLLMGALTLVLQWLEFKYLMRDFTVEIYAGALAVFFTGLGIWVGIKLMSRKALKVAPAASIDFTRNTSYNLTNRELEVLDLIAQGYSNNEIAERLFVSLATIKTHCTNIFLKLDVKRRTQAIQKAKTLGIIA